MAIFIVIALILGGLAFGGIRFIKNRNAHYATQPAQTAPAGQTNKPSNPPAEQQPPSAPANPPSTNPAPAPAPAPAPQPAPAPTPAPNNPPAAPHSVPATGPSAVEMGTTVVLMMLAAFLGMRLRGIRLSYRRHLE